jgi:predicted RNA-binding protein YlxR (DUF448 family)
MDRKGRRRPERTCVQCGNRDEKRSLLRVAGKPGAGWEPDPEGRMPGRGIYLCRKAGCVEGFARRIRTPKGAARWRMGTEGTALAEKICAWWTLETKT